MTRWGACATDFASVAVENVSPVWLPGGKAILFASSRTGHYDLYRQAIPGKSAELLYADGDEKFPTSWSPGGDAVLFDRRSDKAPYKSIGVLSVGDDRTAGFSKVYPLLEGPSGQWDGQFSPDGKWVAYDSQTSDKFQVYLARFRRAGKPANAVRKVSSEAAFFPRWRRDGKELFYYSGTRRRLIAVTFSTDGDAVRLGEERELFGLSNASIVGYDVSSDGMRSRMRLRKWHLNR